MVSNKTFSKYKLKESGSIFHILGFPLGLGFSSFAQNYALVLATKRLTHCDSYERTAKLNENSQTQNNSIH